MHAKSPERLALLAVTSAIAVAACGSSAKPTSSALGGETAGIKLADCVRAHGVPSFPDPTPGELFGQQIASAGVNLHSPAFQTAMSACKNLALAAKTASAPSPEAVKVELVHLAECMRAHGLKTFPDPTTSASSTPPTGESIGYNSPSGSISLSVPQAMIQSPAFTQDATACGFPVPGEPKSARVG
jgi:hypothetical protein